MVKIQESHVAIISEHNKTHMVSWFKNILSADTWALVLVRSTHALQLKSICIED